MASAVWILIAFLCHVSSAIRPELSKVDADSNKLVSHLNPGCNQDALCWNCSNAITVVNVTVKSDIEEDDGSEPNYEHHYLWSVVDHVMLLAALTSSNDYAEIDWGKLLGGGSVEGAFSYRRVPEYSAAVMLMSLIEFDDAENRGLSGANDNATLFYPLTNFNWSRFELENTTDRVAITFVGENYTLPENKDEHKVVSGRINITLAAYAHKGFGVWLPHLSHSDSTNQLDVQLDALNTTSGFNSSRFALHFVFVSDMEKQADLTWTRHSSKTLDDEHTPGIFTTEELIFPGYNDTRQSFMQWRPVVYTTRARELSSSTDVSVSDPLPVANAVAKLNNTSLYAMYGMSLNDIFVASVNVTLGSQGDGFYNKTKYQAWTFTFGTGQPIGNGLSPVAIVIVTCMIIVLAVVFFTMCVIVAVKKYKERKTVVSYRHI